MGSVVVGQSIVRDTTTATSLLFQSTLVHIRPVSPPRVPADTSRWPRIIGRSSRPRDVATIRQRLANRSGTGASAIVGPRTRGD